MSITISKEGAEKNNLSIGAALLLLVMCNDVNLKEAEKELILKGLITANIEGESNKKWRITRNGIHIIDSIIVDSDKMQENLGRLEELARGMKSIFPTGRNTNGYYWAEGVPLIISRLKTFFKKYGNNFSNEDILNATKRYVDSFNGDYKYMKLLKYFIFKEKVGVGGDRESESELLTYMENVDQEDLNGDDWGLELK